MEPLNADRAVELSARFVDRIAARVEESRRFLLPGSGRVIAGAPRRDETLRDRFDEEVREAMEAEGVFDDLLFDRLPKGRRVLWEVRAGGLLVRRTRMEVLAAVVHPVRDLIRGVPARPAPASSARRMLPPEAGLRVPLVGAVLSTGGWEKTEDPDWPEGTSVYLIEPAPGDGFRLSWGPTEMPPGYLAVESEEELRDRVRRYVEESRAQLVLSGLEVAETSARTGVPPALVREAFAAAVREGGFLRLSEEGRTVVLRRI